MDMFCYQCEQTAKGTGCTAHGVCGKPPETAAIQDLLTHVLQGVGQVAHAARQKGIVDKGLDRRVAEGLFHTLTNVDFDDDRLENLMMELVGMRKQIAEEAEYTNLTGAAALIPAANRPALLAQAAKWGFSAQPGEDPDIRALIHTVIFGLRGVAAYAYHAAILGQEDEALYGFIHRALAASLDPSLDLGAWLELTLETGKWNIRAMELLDAGNTGTFGHPVPTAVPLGPKAGKAILVSGHDLLDLKELLEQTAGKGINIYTHGEMLPAHGYPELHKHPHLAGHYGTAWQNQGKEFAAFPGAILMTTNCIQKPKDSYKDNIFTTGPVGWPGVPHVTHGKFGPVIEKALALPGFPAAEDKGSVMVGFARNAVLGVAGKVIDLVKSGKIKHFFLVAGCDGAKPGRNYYTEFVEKAPEDSVILTLACGKFRFFDKNLGDIEGIPRLLDVGQCNDAYSAVVIANALAEAFGIGVNDLPLSMVLSWYEQKAVAILLSLLYLGIKDIRLGPTLPAFLTPNVLNVLVEKFAIKPISTPDDDLKAILGAAA